MKKTILFEKFKDDESRDKARLKQTTGVLRADEFQHEVVRALCAGFPCP